MGTALPAVMAGASFLGSTMSAYGEYETGKQERDAYNYNAQVAEQNALEESRKLKEENKNLTGAQAALYAKAGVDISDSPLLVMKHSIEKGKENQLGVLRRGYDQANLLRSYGRNAMKAGRLKALTTVFGGGLKSGTSMYTNYGGTDRAVNNRNYGGKDYGSTFGLGGTD